MQTEGHSDKKSSRVASLPIANENKYVRTFPLTIVRLAVRSDQFIIHFYAWHAVINFQRWNFKSFFYISNVDIFVAAAFAHTMGVKLWYTFVD